MSMKKDNSILLVAGAIIGTLLWKRNNTSGVGAVKRRIWTELDHAQQANIDLDSAYDDLSAADHRTLERLANQSGFKQSPRSNKPYAEAYYGQLRRAYKSIAGTDLPYDESVVRNENDDVILISQEGIIIRVHVPDITVQSRYGSGVRVMRLAEGDKVMVLARTEHDDEAAAEKPEEAPAEELSAEEIAALEAADNAAAEEAPEAEAEGGEE